MWKLEEFETTSKVEKWRLLGLACNVNGEPHPNLSNALLVLENDPALCGLIYFDEFLHRIMFNQKPLRELDDTDELNILVLHTAQGGHQEYE